MKEASCLTESYSDNMSRFPNPPTPSSPFTLEATEKFWATPAFEHAEI